MKKLFLILSLLCSLGVPSFASGSSGPSVADVNQLYTKTYSFNMSQAAGTYTIGTVSSGDIMVQDVTCYVSVAAVGLVSVAIQTNDTTVSTILATTLLVALTGGKNLTPFTTLTYLPSGKLIQGTIVGTGSGGTLLVVVRYVKMASASVLG